MSTSVYCVMFRTNPKSTVYQLHSIHKLRRSANAEMNRIRKNERENAPMSKTTFVVREWELEP